ncbi:MAG TPA: serpin family protein [Trebonia sp.]|jgi:serpin B|nr:serpin family protein [Trebonia sp.]
MTSITEEVQADAAFGTDMYLKLAATGNVVFSPASIAAALRMALAGARGDTAAELAAVLHLPGPEAAADGLKQLAAIRPGDDLTFRAPNMMWLQSALSVRDSYLAQLSGTVSVERCDFSGAPEAARETINGVIAEQTAGKIANLIPPGVIDRLTRLVLTNAVYMKALWKSQFPADETKQKPFYPERTAPTPTDLMHLQASLAYHRGDGYQAVLLPYRGGSLAMAAVLPDGPLTEFTAGLAGLGGLGGLMSGLLSDGAECQVDLSLPRFRVDASFMLKDTLEALGVRTAFTPEADFSGITGDAPLSISAVVHKAYVDVGEEGTEAAAATAVSIRTLAMVRKPQPQVTLVFDRPFLFAIAETTTGLPLFLGQFTRPAGAR